MRIGVDVGGTKIAVIALDGEGRRIAVDRRPTPFGDYGALLEAIAGSVREMERRVGEASTVGVGVPGALDPETGRIKNANTVVLNDRPLGTDLDDVLGRPVALANDADCFALSEARHGAGAGEAVVFGAIIGTGVGGGVVIDGSLLRGANAIAGEWGHNPLPWAGTGEIPGPPCFCGRFGCIEMFVAGPAIERTHTGRTGRRVRPARLAGMAVAGDREAVETLRLHADRTARALASVINVLDPGVIVLGGGVSNLSHLYTAVPALWDRYVFSDRVRTRLVAARHGDDSGLRGAALL